VSRDRSRIAPRAPPGTSAQAPTSTSRASTPASPGRRLYLRIEADKAKRRIKSQCIGCASFDASNLIEAQQQFAEAGTDDLKKAAAIALGEAQGAADRCLHGYRILAIDLDPQSSLSALMGHQPEADVAENETLYYGALRYDERRRPLRESAKQTYFAGSDIVPGNLELQEFEHDTSRVLATQRRAGDEMFFTRSASAIHSVEAMDDVAGIDCPPRLGFLTRGTLDASTGVVVTAHPQMLDLTSMSQFLLMTGDAGWEERVLRTENPLFPAKARMNTNECGRMDRRGALP
jgi:hypothetical protein